MIGSALALVLQIAATAMPVPSPSPADTIGRGEAATAGRTGASQAPFDASRFDASRFDAVTAVTLRGLFEDAAEMGLPTRPLVNRALEGAARRVSSERILRVVRDFAAALHEARQLLGRASSADELDAGASALRAGVDDGMLEAIRRVRPPGTAVPALVVATDLVKRGVPRDRTRSAVITLAASPRGDDALLGLQATVAKNAPRGPGMAVAALDRYLRATSPDARAPTTSGPATGPSGRPPDP